MTATLEDEKVRKARVLSALTTATAAGRVEWQRGGTPVGFGFMASLDDKGYYLKADRLVISRLNDGVEVARIEEDIFGLDLLLEEVRRQVEGVRAETDELEDVLKDLERTSHANP